MHYNFFYSGKDQWENAEKPQNEEVLDSGVTAKVQPVLTPVLKGKFDDIPLAKGGIHIKSVTYIYFLWY